MRRRAWGGQASPLRYRRVVTGCGVRGVLGHLDDRDDDARNTGEGDHREHHWPEAAPPRRAGASRRLRPPPPPPPPPGRPDPLSPLPLPAGVAADAVPV